MFKSALCCSLAMGAVAVVGCNKQEPATPSGGTTTAPAAADTTAAPSAPATPGTPAEPATPAPAVSAPATAPAVSATPAVPTTAPAESAASAGAPSPDAQADALMTQLEQQIKDKKWDDAKATITQLEGMKDQLSTGVRAKLATLKATADAGSAAGNLGIPGTK